MEPIEETEFKVSTTRMYKHGGVVNVLDCIISMLETELIILKKLKELVLDKK